METLEDIIDTEEYRDSIATVDETGKRIWVHAKKPKGQFTTWRSWVAYLLLGGFFIMPFIWVEGHPFLLLNLFERKFILFGNVFMPQDFHLLALTLITFFVFIILFTVVYGRIWCGWICPQTLFMESVFRRIEYLIEGDANKQRKLNAQPWNQEKLFKKTLKQVVFFLIAILVAHTAMAYLVGIDQVQAIVSKPPTHNLSGFMGLMFFTGLFYFVFSYLREQACIAVCPYGRLQGVLLGKDSIVVAYDFIRGEPRGKIKRKKNSPEGPLKLHHLETPKGDCIDCKLCVQVCPTGIDIRNGTQLECVNCTACMDACDQVMDKIEKPKGLIRYASYNNIVNKTKLAFTPRIIAYSIVLIALLSFDVYLLRSRADIEATVLRVPGSLFTEMPNGDIRNQYSIQIANKSFEEKSLSLKLIGIEGKLQIAGQELLAPENATSNGSFLVDIPPDALKPLKTPIKIEIWSGDELMETITTNFLGPAN